METRTAQELVDNCNLTENDWFCAFYNPEEFDWGFENFKMVEY